jgi:hypothetical protein
MTSAGQRLSDWRMKGLPLTGSRDAIVTGGPDLVEDRHHRAADGGGLRPSLTAAARGATWHSGRDEETAPVKQRN